jgi:hypothetical protein
MIASVRRIPFALLVGVPLVAAVTGGLLLMPHAVSLVLMLIGMSGLMASETFRSKRLACVGGWLALSGGLAWAMLAGPG